MKEIRILQGPAMVMLCLTIFGKMASGRSHVHAKGHSIGTEIYFTIFPYIVISAYRTIP